MDVIYGLIPSMLIVGLVMVGVLYWAARSGQFDDLEGDAQRILMDDDLRPEPGQATAQERQAEKPEPSPPEDPPASADNR
jgi:cbb3-type cytochrome oxidase maturation protein